MTDDAPRTLSYQTLYQSRPLNDRKNGLVVFGIITIIMGACSGCMGLMSPLALLMPMPAGQPHMRAGAIVSGALLYVAAAGALIWVGIGSLHRRRWVRPVILAAAVQLVAVGIITTATMAVMFPKLIKLASAAGGTPKSFMLAGMAGVIGFTFILTVIVPGVFILFYRSPHVRTTLECDDPHARWTDDIPIPVLGITLALLSWGAIALIYLPVAIIPAFGTVLHGPPAIGVFLAVAAATLGLAFLTHRRHPAGWWGTLALVVIYLIAVESTNLRGDLPHLYQNAGYSQFEIQTIEQVNGNGLLAAIQGLLVAVVAVGYLLWVRKYYFRAQVR